MSATEQNYQWRDNPYIAGADEFWRALDQNREPVNPFRKGSSAHRLFAAGLAIALEAKGINEREREINFIDGMPQPDRIVECPVCNEEYYGVRAGCLCPQCRRERERERRASYNQSSQAYADRKIRMRLLAEARARRMNEEREK